jgi:hypothetical protein
MGKDAVSATWKASLAIRGTIAYVIDALRAPKVGAP